MIKMTGKRGKRFKKLNTLDTKYLVYDVKRDKLLTINDIIYLLNMMEDDKQNENNR